MCENISIIILTFNEQRHIARCIESIKTIASEVIIIDSFSTDETLKIAQSYGANVYQHKFSNQADQLNWALDNCPIKSQWIFRLDADEIATPELCNTIKHKLLSFSNGVSGLTINRRIHFLGKWIQHGGIYPISVLRIWKKGYGRCESRLMDEHIIVDGEIQHLPHDIVDINLNNLTWWISKHNNYSSREAIEVLKNKGKNKDNLCRMEQTSKEASRKRWIKENIYSKLPFGLRAFLYFIYRYVFRLGFLDSWQGFAFHVLQGFWYRFLVDLKISEFETMMQEKSQTLDEVTRSELGYKTGQTK